MRRQKKALLAVALGLSGLLTPSLVAVLETESKLSARFAKVGEELPLQTTELMGFFSVQEREGNCIGTAAKQLGTELAPADVARFIADGPLLEGEHSLLWFQKKRVVLHQLSTSDEHVLTQDEVDALPMAARFLLNVHAFLPEGVRRVVLFSSERIESRFEPRCW